MEVSLGEIRADNQPWVLQKEIIWSPCYPSLSSSLGLSPIHSHSKSCLSHIRWSLGTRTNELPKSRNLILVLPPSHPAKIEIWRFSWELSGWAPFLNKNDHRASSMNRNMKKEHLHVPSTLYLLKGRFLLHLPEETFYFLPISVTSWGIRKWTWSLPYCRNVMKHFSCALVSPHFTSKTDSSAKRQGGLPSAGNVAGPLESSAVLPRKMKRRGFLCWVITYSGPTFQN